MTKSLMATSAKDEVRVKVLVHKSPAHIRDIPKELNDQLYNLQSRFWAIPIRVYSVYTGILLQENKIKTELTGNFSGE